MNDPTLVESPEDIDPRWMTAALRRHGFEGDVTHGFDLASAFEPGGGSCERIASSECARKGFESLPAYH